VFLSHWLNTETSEIAPWPLPDVGTMACLEFMKSAEDVSKLTNMQEPVESARTEQALAERWSGRDSLRILGRRRWESIFCTMHDKAKERGSI